MESERERDAVWDGEWAKERRGLWWNEQERDETKEIESERETKDKVCSGDILKFQIKSVFVKDDLGKLGKVNLGKRCKNKEGCKKKRTKIFGPFFNLILFLNRYLKGAKIKKYIYIKNSWKSSLQEMIFKSILSFDIILKVLYLAI